MGDGSVSPDSLSVDDFSDRYSNSVSGSGVQSSVSSSSSNVVLVSDGGDRYSEQEFREVIKENVLDYLDELDNVLDQTEIKDAFGVNTRGVLDRWADNPQAEGNRPMVTAFGESQDNLPEITQNGVINGDALTPLTESSATGIDDGKKRIKRIAESYGVDETAKLLNTLRSNAGQSIHDIGEDFSAGEKEILANLEMVRDGREISDFRDNGGYAGAGVGFDTDSVEELERKLEENGSVLVGMQSNDAFSSVSREMREKSVTGNVPESVNVDEVIDKIRSNHTTECVRCFDSAEELRHHVSGEAGTGHFSGMNSADPNTVNSQTQLSPEETQFLAETLVESRELTVDELETELEHSLGYNPDMSNPFHNHVDVPAQKLVVKTTDVTSKHGDKINLNFDATSDATVHPRSDSNCGNLPFSYNETDVMVVEANEEGTIQNITCKHVNEYDLHEKSTKHYTGLDTRAMREQNKGGTNEDRVLVLGDGNQYRYSEQLSTQSSSQGFVRPAGANDVQTKEDLNTQPDTDSAYHIRDLRTAVHDTFLDRDTDVFFTGGRGGDERPGKQIGDDGEQLLIENMYPNYSDPVGAHETNQFPDLPRAAVEVKTYQMDNIRRGNVNLGVQNPSKAEQVTEKIHESSHPESAPVIPKHSRYVFVGYESSGTSIDDLTAQDLDSVIDAQPAVDWDTMTRDGVTREDVVNGSVPVENALREDITDSDFSTISGVTIASGDALTSQNKDPESKVKLSERPNHQIKLSD